jgi:hypothetical protein
MKYYTYAYLREDRTPYYIGKGKGRRIYSTNRKFKPPKDKSRIIYLKRNLTEEEAFRHEIYMIAVFGRKDIGTGILHNKTDGGEGVSGIIHSEETRNKNSNAKKGENNPQYGKTRSIESKRKQSEAMKGKNNPNYGKNRSIETKTKISENQLKYNYKIYSIKESKIYETNNLNSFCQDNMLFHSNVMNTLNGNRKHHKGFVLVEKVEIQHQQS